MGKECLFIPNDRCSNFCFLQKRNAIKATTTKITAITIITIGMISLISTAPLESSSVSVPSPVTQQTEGRSNQVGYLRTQQIPANNSLGFTYPDFLAGAPPNPRNWLVHRTTRPWKQVQAQWNRLSNLRHTTHSRCISHDLYLEGRLRLL